MGWWGVRRTNTASLVANGVEWVEVVRQKDSPLISYQGFIAG